MTAIGAILTLGVDLAAMHIIRYMYSSRRTSLTMRSPGSLHLYRPAIEMSPIGNTMQTSPANHSQETAHANYWLNDSIHAHSDTDLNDSDPSSDTLVISEKRAQLRAYMLESAIAIHSVIIGFGYGTLPPHDIVSIRLLGTVFSCHQFFEGVSLSMAVIASPLTRQVASRFALIFALTFPLGAVVGMWVRSSVVANDVSPTDGQGGGSASSDNLGDNALSTAEVIQGMSNALAAGILLYTAMVEMIPEEFSSHHNHGGGEGWEGNKTTPRGCVEVLGRYGALCAGFGCMAVMAVWA